MGHKKDHSPKGNPCSICGLAPNAHRVYHKPVGSPCEKCGLSVSKHKTRQYHKPEGDPCARCGEPAREHRAYNSTKEKAKNARRHARHADYIGIDGEGVGRLPHRYTLLAASNESGTFRAHVEAKPGERLTTVQCLDFILSLPTNRTKIFAYAFNYDLTKILEDVDDKTLYFLFRPELRQREKDKAMLGPRPVKWKGYSLNLQGTKFTLKKKSKRVIIWDVFKFFQGKFVKALKDWKVGTNAVQDKIQGMKEKRSEFVEDNREAIREYCYSECRALAELVRKLVMSHEEAGLKLTKFYGAGSSGAAMLSVMGIKEKIRPVPDAMRESVASAFFGGRFENAMVGPVREELWSYDISSAYPYQTTFLPCLEHAEWVLTKDEALAAKSRIALVQYRLHANPRIEHWGPFPFRERDGSISFPASSGGGWVWQDEYRQGKKLYPRNVEFIQAWLYRHDCQCRPFARIPEYYRHRLILGKEGPGIVIKLAVNSCYGKLAQSIGNAMFNSWIWAGLITSGCRAQILEFLSLHKKRENMLMVATDGIVTRERINPPVPLDTETGEVALPDGNVTRKPLGGWEEKHMPKGVFMARPGIYFPCAPTEEELKDIRARGIGKGVVLEQWEKIITTYEREGVNGIVPVANVQRFCGAKTSIHFSNGKGYTRASWQDGAKPCYGDWISRRVEMTFDPMPKRAGVLDDGQRLRLREFGPDDVSVAYDKAAMSREAAELKIALQEIIEQPDADFTDWVEIL